MKAKRKKGNRRTRATNVIAAERRIQAIALRREGKTFAEIGAALGVSNVAAFKMVTKTLDAANALLVTETKALRQRQLDEMAVIKGALWTKATDGSVGAVDRIDKIWSREAKLAGLDAPSKHDHTSGGKPIDFREMRERVAGRIAALAAGVQSASNEADKPEAMTGSEPPEPPEDDGGGA
jgi:hypothetical protein